MADTVLYTDNVVELNEQGITLRRYYFPLALSKHIPYTAIHNIEQRPMGIWTGKGRLWGSGDLRHWAPLDLHRPHKDTVIILDLGRYIQPVFSPNDPERVLALLHQHMPTTTP